MCVGTGREAKDVGISTRRGARCACPLSREGGAQGERDVRRGDGVSETDGYVSIFSRFSRFSRLESIFLDWLFKPTVKSICIPGIPYGSFICDHVI